MKLPDADLNRSFLNFPFPSKVALAVKHPLVSLRRSPAASEARELALVTPATKPNVSALRVLTSGFLFDPHRVYTAYI